MEMRVVGYERSVMPHVVVVVFFSFTLGCVGAEDSNATSCDTGSVVTCLCADGTESVEHCPDDLDDPVCRCSTSENAITAKAGLGGASDQNVASAEAIAESEDETVAAQVEPELDHFSFFVTSLEALQRLSGSSTGFGGDLRYGEADGLSGADKICSEIAEYSMPGAGRKEWRAFLSATQGGQYNGPVHAIERIGSGPWYDRLGRVVAMTITDLINIRPSGADPVIVDDLPNEYGVPNHAPDGEFVDNHHVLTGSSPFGTLIANDPRLTCQDWTSAVGEDGTPTVGMSWPRMGGGVFAVVGGNWISDHNEAGCAPVDFSTIAQSMGGGSPGADGVGSGGGYGGFYCFALTP